MGDTLFATPAIRTVRENFPKAKIIILASPAAAKILKANPYGMEVVVLNNNWIILKILGLIRKGSYDLVLGLSWTSSFFTRFCAAAQTGDFFSVNNTGGFSVIQYCFEVLKTVGVNPGSFHTEFWVKSETGRKVERFLENINYNIKLPLIAVHIGGHYFVRKRWPVPYFVELIRFLTKEGFQVALVGGCEDLKNSLQIEEAIPEVLSAVGKLKLEETAELLKRSRLLIGNDSGPLHLAAAVGIPTIGLFGPTSPDEYYPYHSPSNSYIYKSFSCSPCYRFGGGIWQNVPKCSRPYCMEAIVPQEVLLKAEQILIQSFPCYEVNYAGNS